MAEATRVTKKKLHEKPAPSNKEIEDDFDLCVSDLPADVVEKPEEYDSDAPALHGAPDEPPAAEAERSISSFNEVVFHNVMHQYPVEAHVECKFVCGGEVRPTARDWVGLFKVGWTSTVNYATYSYVKPDENNALQATAFFMNKYLPKEEYEFYQFVYVTESGLVKGASTPFRFCRPIGDDYVTEEIEGSEGDEDLLIVTSRSVALENSLRQLTADKAQLANAVERLECLRQEEAARAEQYGQEKAQLGTEVEELRAKLEAVVVLERERTQMREEQVQLREQLVAVSGTAKENQQVLETKQRRINDLEKALQTAKSTVDVLHEDIKLMETDMAALRKALQDKETILQNELSKVEDLMKQLCETQNKATAHEKDSSEKIMALQSQLLVNEKLLQEYTHKSRVLESEMDSARNQLAAAESTIQLHKEELAGLSDKLKHTEEVCEEQKMLLSETVASKEELLEADQARRSTEARVSELQQQVTAERQRADEARAECQEKLNQANCRHQYLEQAYSSIKDRCLRVERRRDNSRSQLQEMVDLNRELLAREEALRTRAADLERRLKQGAIEYKKVYTKLLAVQPAGDQSLDVKEADQVFDTPPDLLAPPLTPLPPPIQPQKAASPLLAAIGDETGDETSSLSNRVDSSETAASAVAVAAAATDDDQFHDAVVQQPQPQQRAVSRGLAPSGTAATEPETYHDAPEAQLCPVCEEPFPADMEDASEQLERHVADHFPSQPAPLVCPVCHEEMPADATTQGYEQHVYAHFNN